MPDVTILVWKNAKTEPPDGDRLVLTDLLEFAHYDSDDDPEFGGAGWYFDNPHVGSQWLEPQPSLWADVRSPGDDPLTTDDLQDLADLGEHGLRAGSKYVQRAAVRLRRAIENLEDQDE